MATALSNTDVSNNNTASSTNDNNTTNDNNNNNNSSTITTAEAYQYLYQTEERSRECLIRLNNRAVRYLQSGRQRLALQTFHTAFEVLQQKRDPATFLSSSLAAAENTEDEEEIPDHFQNNNLQVPTVVSSSYSPALALAAFGPQENVCICIDDDRSVDTDRVAAVGWPLVKCTLVYNFGVCHCNVAYNNNPGHHAHFLQLGTLCLTIYQYAESLLPASDDDAYLLLSLILLRKLQAWTAMLNMPLADDYQRNVDLLVATIQQQEQQQHEQQQQQDSSQP